MWLDSEYGSKAVLFVEKIKISLEFDIDSEFYFGFGVNPSEFILMAVGKGILMVDGCEFKGFSKILGWDGQGFKMVVQSDYCGWLNSLGFIKIISNMFPKFYFRNSLLSWWDIFVCIHTNSRKIFEIFTSHQVLQ